MAVRRSNPGKPKIGVPKPLITDPELIRLLMRFIRVWIESGQSERKIKSLLYTKFRLTTSQYWSYWEKEKQRKPVKLGSKQKIFETCCICGIRFQMTRGYKRGKVTDWQGKLRLAHLLCIKMAPFSY